jgi:hypothetical protein
MMTNWLNSLDQAVKNSSLNNPKIFTSSKYPGRVNVDRLKQAMNF